MIENEAQYRVTQARERGSQNWSSAWRAEKREASPTRTQPYAEPRWTLHKASCKNSARNSRHGSRDRGPTPQTRGIRHSQRTSRQSPEYQRPQNHPPKHRPAPRTCRVQCLSSSNNPHQIVRGGVASATPPLSRRHTATQPVSGHTARLMPRNHAERAFSRLHKPRRVHLRQSLPQLRQGTRTSCAHWYSLHATWTAPQRSRHSSAKASEMRRPVRHMMSARACTWCRLWSASVSRSRPT